MTSDNTSTMKRGRAYKRLLCAILESQPKNLIDGFVFEAVDCPTTAGQLQKDIENLRTHALKDAENYYIHYQGGRPVPILKKSPLGRKLSKGAFSPINEEV